MEQGQGAPVPHAGGQDLVGLDALVGGFVVVDEQALVEQEAPSGGAASVTTAVVAPVVPG